MNAEQPLYFPPFRLDAINQRLWREEQEIPLRQKTFAVLCYLVEHPDQLLTKEALLNALWPETYVSDTVLTVCIRELRRALSDDKKTPRFIATVHGRGYRFIAPITTAAHPVSGSRFLVSGRESQQLETRNQKQETPLVGREAELTQLHRWLAKAVDGERQLVFVTGEPGIGKTMLVDAFLAEVGAGRRACPLPGQLQVVAHTPDLWVSRGHCNEHFGAGEPYLPLLEAVSTLCRGPDGAQFVAVLKQYAPTWLVQLPALLDNGDLDLLQRKTAGATRERMSSELAEALEVLTTKRPLVLVLEDLHWSDLSTLEFVSYLARRRQSCRLLMIGAYRPVEMLSDSHPLQRVLHELYAPDPSRELTLSRLTESEVNAYLTLRFPDSVLPTRLGQILQQRTGGNPLFLANMVQDVVQRSMLHQEEDGRWTWCGQLTELERWTPESVRHVLARQRERLTQDEQRVLAAASLAGTEFSAAAVAAALETEVTQIEEHCGRLAEQQQFLRLAGISEWPDGTRAGRYGFLHALYQEFWHERVSVGRQQQWHLQMGERKEAAYGKRAREIAVELAVHFEQGRDYRRAVRYLHLAGETAVRRNAHQEAIQCFTKGLELLKTLPDTRERTQQEFPLQLALGGPRSATQGFAAPEVKHAYDRALALCRQGGETPQLFRTLNGLCGFYIVRAEHRAARELAEECLSLAQRLQDPALLLGAHYVLGMTFFWHGELVRARAHQKQTLAFYHAQQNKGHFASWLNLGVNSLNYAAFTLRNLGYPDQALKRSQEAIALAHELAQPFSLGMALCFVVDVHLGRGEGQAAQERAEELMTLSIEQGFTQLLADGTMFRGAALVQQGQVEEGIIQMQRGISAGRATGFEMGRTGDLAGLALGYAKAGQIEKGLTIVAEALALVDKTEERVSEAELYILKGWLLLARSQESHTEAEAYFRQTLVINRR